MAINYTTKSNAWNVFYVNLQANDTLFGECTLDNITQEVTFELHDEVHGHAFLKLIFTSDSKDSKYGLSNLVYNFTLNEADAIKNEFVNATGMQAGPDSDYTIDSGSSYYCYTKIENVFTNISVSYVEVTAAFNDFRYQAFHNQNSFNTERKCGADFGTSDIVPIAVGCALAALVVVVLIAYLIGRRRSRQKGYQSV